MLKTFAHLLRLNQGSHRESERKKRLGGSPVLVDRQFPLKDASVRIVHAGGREELYKFAVPASELMEKYRGMCVARPDVFRNPIESLLYPDEELLPGHKYLMIPMTTARKLKYRHMKKIKSTRSADTKDKQPVLRITWKSIEDTAKKSASSVKYKRAGAKSADDKDEQQPVLRITWKSNEDPDKESASSAKHKQTNKIKGRRSANDKDERQPTLWITWESAEDTTKESASSAKEFYASKDNFAICQMKKSKKGVTLKKQFVQPIPKAASFKESNGWEPRLSSIKELSP